MLLTAYDMQELKKHVGYVAQESQLFAGTIRDNLLFVKPDASDEEMFAVLDSAQIGELIRSNEA